MDSCHLKWVTILKVDSTRIWGHSKIDANHHWSYDGAEPNPETAPKLSPILVVKPIVSHPHIGKKGAIDGDLLVETVNGKSILSVENPVSVRDDGSAWVTPEVV